MSWWTSQEIHPKTKSKFVVVFGGVFYLPNIKSLNKPKIDFDTKEYRLLNHKFNYPGNGTWQPITMKFVDMNGMGRQQDHFDTGAFLWQILNNTGYTYPYVDNSQFRDPHFRNVNSKTADEFGGGHHISTKIDVDGSSTWRTITTPEKSSTIANSFGLGLENVADFKNASVSKQRISIYQLAPFTGKEKTKENVFVQSDGTNFSPEGDTPLGATITECWHLVNPIVKSVGWGDLAYDSDELVEYELGVVYDWAIMDRTQIGKPFTPNAVPYQKFMKTLFVDNEEAIVDKKLKAANFNFENTTPLSVKQGPVDLDGNGEISDLERKLSQDPSIRERAAQITIENKKEADARRKLNAQNANDESRIENTEKRIDSTLSTPPAEEKNGSGLEKEDVPPNASNTKSPEQTQRDSTKEEKIEQLKKEAQRQRDLAEKNRNHAKDKLDDYKYQYGALAPLVEAIENVDDFFDGTKNTNYSVHGSRELAKRREKKAKQIEKEIKKLEEEE